ncbi:MAG TPA: DUF4192 domain-containing protein [Trebonia sp.]
MTRNLPADGQPSPSASTAAPARSKRAQRAPRQGARQARPRQAAQQAQAQPRQPWPGRAPRGGGAPDARTPPLRVRIGSPESLLAVIPGLLGFEPGNSIVVVGTESPGCAVRVTLRYDVPDPRRTAATAALAGHAVAVLAAQGVTTAVAVGYGGDAAVSPVAAALRERAAEAGIALTEVLRAEGQRYWSYVCADPACCPPEGTPYDVTGHPAARALAAAGGQVLAGRDELSASLAPAGGQLGAAMRRGTAKAHAQVARCVARLDRAGLQVTAARLTGALGQVAVRDAIRRYRDGEQVGTEHAAWLTVALRQLRVRDDAWARMEPEHRSAHLRLWTDLTRLARPGYVAAPAALLAFCAWQAGDGALANVALDRALADNPGYSMALLLREALDSGAPPAMARLPMTPEEVAAAYDAAEGGARTA